MYPQLLHLYHQSKCNLLNCLKDLHNSDKLSERDKIYFVSFQVIMKIKHGPPRKFSYFAGIHFHLSCELRPVLHFWWCSLPRHQPKTEVLGKNQSNCHGNRRSHQDMTLKKEKKTHFFLRWGREPDYLLSIIPSASYRSNSFTILSPSPLLV